MALAIVAFPILLALLMPSWRAMAVALLVNLPLGVLFAWPQIADPVLRPAGIGIAIGAYVWGIVLGSAVYGIKRLFVRRRKNGSAPPPS